MSPLASLRRLLLEAVVASFLPDRIRRRGGNRRRWRGSRKEKNGRVIYSDSYEWRYVSVKNVVPAADLALRVTPQ